MKLGATRIAASAFVVVALLLFVLPSPASAGPWVPERGHGYAKLWVKYLLGFGFNDSQGQSHNYANYHELFLASYGEVGLGRRFSLYWHSDLVRSFHLRDPVQDQLVSHVASGDPALGIGYQLPLEGRLAMALRAQVRAPLARTGPVQTVYLRSPESDGSYQAVGELRTGEGAASTAFAFEAGYGFDTWYLGASLGYEVRYNDYRDRITWSAEIGLSFNETFSGRLRMSGAHSLRGTGDAPLADTPSGLGNGVSWAGVALEGEWEFRPSTFVGLTLEGGLGGLRSQTGGPVVSLFFADQF